MFVAAKSLDADGLCCQPVSMHVFIYREICCAEVWLLYLFAYPDDRDTVSPELQVEKQ